MSQEKSLQMGSNKRDRVGMTQDTLLLCQIIDKIKETKTQGNRSLVVFDLDSTLFDVGPRQQGILDDFAKKPDIQAKFPHILRQLLGVRVQPGDWGIHDALERSGILSHSEEFLSHLKAYWRTHFFSNERLHHDVPYPGAVHYVQLVHQAGAEIVYLTGRDVERMGDGSKEVLLKWGFPLDPNARLELKPHRQMPDAPFKTDWFLNLPNGHYQHIWFFENEPHNIIHLRQQAPEVSIIFFDSTHSRMAPPPTDLPVISHFVLDDEC